MVRPWKEFRRVMIVARPSPYFSKDHLRAVLIMPSLASAPELPKNAAFIPAAGTSLLASLA